VKRRNTDEGEGGLDSLLDTMTNVVGILVIVLVVTQLGVGEAVKRITDSIQIDAEQLAEAERRLEELKAQRDALLAAMADEQPADDVDYEQRLQQLQQQIQQQQSVLDRLRAEEQVRNAKLKQVADSKQREKEINEARQRVDKLTEQWKAKDVELERLRQLLARTPERQTPPPEEIKLPDPKPAPEGAKQLTIVCSNNKVYLVPDASLLEPIRKSAQARALYVAGRQRSFNPATGEGVERFVEEFNKQPLQDKPLKYFDIKLYNSNSTPRLIFHPRATGGEDERIVKGTRSRFQNILADVDKNRFYLRFYVCTDSFDIYVTTRRIVSDMGLLAGWDPQSVNWKFTTHLGGDLRFGPPPPPKPKPPKPAVEKPTKPPNVID